jgi:hypothetical protein
VNARRQESFHAAGARDSKRLKRGGGRVRLELLTRLAEEDATAAWVAYLQLFGRLSVQEAGAALGVWRSPTGTAGTRGVGSAKFSKKRIVRNLGDAFSLDGALMGEG